LIRRMVADLALPVEVVGVPTMREADGLAMSSRNRYLSDEERQRAPALYRTLCGTVQQLAAGRRDYPVLEQEAMGTLAQQGLRPEYFSIRRAEDLAPPQDGKQALVILAAAWLGSARLIDNVCVRVGDE
ncbi:MAG: pantoate--beta-alanine ligase, partial [Gammaproteobacteria bacterium]